MQGIQLFISVAHFLQKSCKTIIFFFSSYTLTFYCIFRLLEETTVIFLYYIFSKKNDFYCQNLAFRHFLVLNKSL